MVKMEATVLLIDWTFPLRGEASHVFNSWSLSNRTDIFEPVLFSVEPQTWTGPHKVWFPLAPDHLWATETIWSLVNQVFISVTPNINRVCLFLSLRRTEVLESSCSSVGSFAGSSQY